MLHDDQLSLTLAFFIGSKYQNSSSIRLLLHPYLYLGLVDTEKELTHFQVIVLPTSHEKHLYTSLVLLPHFYLHPLLGVLSFKQYVCLHLSLDVFIQTTPCTLVLTLHFRSIIYILKH
jgi:hypothetical protein